MRCWVCGATAEAVCRFCGRGICKAHARTQPFVFDIWPTQLGLRGLAVEDAIWCGVCRTRPDPVPMDFLERFGNGVAPAPAGSATENAPQDPS